jgi:eukaryotic-like serine/threonine-protein kinase
MIVRGETCDTNRLEQFLHDRLPENSRRELEAHLLLCPACRSKLDELAGGAPWWTEVRRHLGGDGAAESLPTSDQAAPRRQASVDLYFLEPSDNPAALGRLGPYEVLEVLGQGGMGVVLKAFDPSLHRPVAIKVLAAEFAANGAARKRFAREAQAVAAVIHDHVVPVHAVDAQATPPYLVMAFIPGQSLQQRIDRSGPLELKEILRIGMQTASGLAAAHAQGLVHRDIKPANIMLENGIERVRITDFGLARAVGDVSVTQSGAVPGTPQYMAPEQAGGEVVDQRADLFALGSTIYAMCTGRAPFRGSTGLAVIRQVCDVEPTSIRAINPDMPVWLEGIVRKLHAKDPAQRFQSAAEVADLLERCLAHVQQPDRQFLPRLAEELGRQVPGPRLPRRYHRWRQVGAVLAISVLGGAVLLLLPQSGKHDPAFPPGERAVGALGNYDGPTDIDDVRDGSSRVRVRLDGLGQELSAASPNDGLSLEPAFDSLRQRAEMLHHNLNADAESSPDPVAAELENIRRRLDLLQQHVGHRLD